MIALTVLLNISLASAIYISNHVGRDASNELHDAGYHPQMKPFKAPSFSIENDFDHPSPSERPTRAVGKLPALGWNTWNAFNTGKSQGFTNINEAKVLEAANSMVSLGLKEAGYVYVNIDDAWSNKTGRDPVSYRIRHDPIKFPDGIKGTAAKIHALGLKIGIYSDAGTKTCAGYPGSLGYEDIDAATFAEWDIDYLKYDNCNVPKKWQDISNPGLDYDWFNSNSSIRFRRMTTALNSVPRMIEYSLCIWGEAHVWTWGSRVGHSWRMTADASADWNFISFAIAKNSQYLDHYGFWGWGDMDMMEIGNGDLTLAEQRTHFAAWCFLKSPILLGTSLNRLSKEQLSIITNRQLLAFHQDPTVGEPAKPLTKGNDTTPPEYYVGKSSRGMHVFVINTEHSAANKSIVFSDVPGLGAGKWVVHDMWTAQNIGNATMWTTQLEAHDTAAYFISPA